MTSLERAARVRLDVDGLPLNSVVPALRGTFWEVQSQLTKSFQRDVQAPRSDALCRWVRSTNPMPHSHSGAFFVTAPKVTAVRDATVNATYYDLALDFHWEPRYPVFRMQATPTLTRGRDDAGRALTATSPTTKAAVAGFVHSTSLRINGLTRQSTAIQDLSGTAVVTASPAMLTMELDKLDSLPATASQEKVTTRIIAIRKEDDRWEIDAELIYPPGQPEFESFESWTTRNEFTVVDRASKKRWKPESSEWTPRGEKMLVTYRYAQRTGPDFGKPADLLAVVVTPAPLIEFVLPFTLREIPLP
ncbi:MAG: hypothetical protein ACRCZF_14230 [Gemmataceae bacterium]